MQKFFKNDESSIIIFEHEDGSVYRGFYYFVHDISGDYPVALNKVALMERPDSDEESFKAYMEKVRLDPAVDLEYTVK